MCTLGTRSISLIYLRNPISSSPRPFLSFYPLPARVETLERGIDRCRGFNYGTRSVSSVIDQTPFLFQIAMGLAKWPPSPTNQARRSVQWLIHIGHLADRFKGPGVWAALSGLFSLVGGGFERLDGFFLASGCLPPAKGHFGCILSH